MKEMERMGNPVRRKSGLPHIETPQAALIDAAGFYLINATDLSMGEPEPR